MLTDKIAVVTGASRGIGKEIALTLAAKGAVVIVNYNGSASKAEDVVREIQEAGGRGEAIQCNVSDYEKASELMAYVAKKYGRVDILVNNAGIAIESPLADFKTELKEGAFHIMEPQKGCKKAEFSRAYCLVPGSVFDRSGNRIGYGKGYYDRYFAAYPKLYRIGIAYESQIEERIKPEKHDRKMHAMVTEHGMRVICNKEDLWN